MHLVDHIIEKVEKITKNLHTNCPYKIADALGINIVYENLGKTLGYYNRHFQIKIIHINESANERLKKFVCAHELGHAIFHPDANTPFLKNNTLFSTDKIELEANLFAVRLLFLDHYFNDQLNLYDAVKSYGIPEKLILNNLKG